MQTSTVPDEDLPVSFGEVNGCVKQGELAEWTGKEEGEWWRGKDDILPIGSGEGSGWEGGRNEGTSSHIHILC